MITRIKEVTYVLMLMSLLTLAACTPLKINPPIPEKQSLLVLPATYTKKSQSSRHSFYYVYEITSSNNQVEPYDAVIKFPLEGDMVIVDALPPGDYHVSKFSYFPMGTGDHTYGKNTSPLNYPFTLGPGTITIFQESFNLLSYNSIPGRGATTSYSFKIDPITDEQRQQILDTLGELENFQSWNVLDTSNAHILRAQGSWSGSWESPSTESCGNGDLRVKVIGSKLSGSGTSASGESLTIAANINEQGKITGELSNPQVLLANVSGGIYSGGEIAGKFIFLDGCESKWSIFKKI
jgi:hypothetical protein